MRAVHIVSYLVDADRYRDRVLMFAEAASRVGRMTLLVGSPPREVALTALPNLRVVPLAPGPRKRQLLQASLLRWWVTHRPRPDLLHDTQGFMAPLFTLLAPAPRRPVRLSSNFASTWDWFSTLRGRWPVEWRERETRYWMQLVEEAALARVTDHFTVFGEGHRDLFARTYRVPVERVHALPNCVDPAAFAAVAPPADDAGFEPGTRLLLFVGATFRYKGIHELLAALAALRPAHPDLRLLIVGKAPGRAGAALDADLAARDLRAIVRVVGRVPRETLPGLMAAAEAVVLPTYTEGSPRVLIEAMAGGRPVVASDIPGVRALDPTGTCLRLVPRADAAALARGIEAVLADPAEAAAMGARARARYLAGHTPAAAGAALADLYRGLVGDR